VDGPAGIHWTDYQSKKFLMDLRMTAMRY